MKQQPWLFRWGMPKSSLENQSSVHGGATPPRASSGPLPPPVAGFMPGYSAAQLSLYEQQLAMAKMSGMQAVLHPRARHMLKQAGMGLVGMGAGAVAGTSQVVNDAGYQNAATAQQLMYCQ
ncbi:hypothetical protein MLD38_006521 [Melastoma candidum]|uniref:Uncharacterized protein n=1 Tax=Melastoma candidum TaxID=119954 RepID=A0ACB9RR61_9MYRT|nr:hypothetical protein MLD38_006521 [Melastoma candidum]